MIRRDEDIASIQSASDYDLYIKMVFEVALIFVWMLIYWKGTKFEEIFSTQTMAFVSVLGIFDAFVHFYNFYEVIGLNIGNKYFQRDKLLNLLFTNLVNQLTVYLRYFFVAARCNIFTQFDGDFGLRKQFISKKQEEIYNKAQEKYKEDTSVIIKREILETVKSVRRATTSHEKAEIMDGLRKSYRK